MSNRPDPVLFAKYSYYLAVASAVILFFGFLFQLPFIPREIGGVLINVSWLALLTGGVGAFMAYAARADFRRNPGPEEAVRQARVGWRVNLGALAVMAVTAAFIVILSLLAAPQ